MQEIYLDNSATTRPYDEVIELMARVMGTCYGNPSSLHAKGLEAEKIVKEARETLARALGCRVEEIIFTSGGTEANNQAIKGVAYRHRRRGNHIITSTIEHPSVLNCCRRLEEEGFEVTYVPVDSEGYILLEELAQALNEQTILVTLAHVNNEIGTIQPLDQIGPLIKKLNPQTLFHVDGAQALAKVPVDLDRWRIDLYSCSAHKIHGPKGVGALWIKTNTMLQPLLQGGEQESGMRSGTENVPGIAGFGLAVRQSFKLMQANNKLMYELKERLLQGLQKAGVDVSVNGPAPRQSAPHLLNLCFPGIKADILLRALEQQGIYASAGSACHSRHPQPSHVLLATGLSEDMVAASLRFSFSGLNSAAEIDTVIQQTVKSVTELRQMLP